ncbi:MAG: glycosyltransferase family 4 protein [Candidatus Woesearchaeota archaeon]|jgi:glycosyltransferase involved in cell wall biosynthesis|nr:glycosyltransferase family 4 protein [Candidatus Woesearchaeota archaeon]
MKILVIMKRFGSAKDMVMENFGRQIRLFEPLAKKHKIDFLCPDYIKKESKIIKRNGLRFIVKPITFFSTGKFMLYLNSLIKKEKYNLIVATTDPLVGIMGYYYSKKFKIPLIYDLQDNFEIYDTYKIPFIGYLDKKIIKKADIVLTVSESLKKYASEFRVKKSYVIQNGVDLEFFKVLDKKKSRKKLKLPLDIKIIVYIGYLRNLKGFDIMVDALHKVRKKYPDAYLLLSGKVGKGIDIKQENVIYMKLAKRQDVVSGINAADVAILPNPDNNFARYCFPYKIVEYMACNAPIVATDVGDVSLLLKKYKGSVCRPDDPEDLAVKIISKLKENKKVNYSKDIKNLTWEKLAKKIDKIITGIYE